VQRFDRQLTENATIIFPADRTNFDNEDPDCAATAPDLNVDDAILGTDTGKAPIEHPLRTWADDDDEDDCVVLEVFHSFPFLFANCLDPGSTDPNAQVLESAAPLAAGRGKVKKTSTRKRAGTTAGATAAPPPKRSMVRGNKPPRRDKNTAPKEPRMSFG
jgi:hypothetical protein